MAIEADGVRRMCYIILIPYFRPVTGQGFVFNQHLFQNCISFAPSVLMLYLYDQYAFATLA
jgi:hypothetical protein